MICEWNEIFSGDPVVSNSCVLASSCVSWCFGRCLRGFGLFRRKIAEMLQWDHWGHGMVRWSWDDHWEPPRHRGFSGFGWWIWMKNMVVKWQ